VQLALEFAAPQEALDMLASLRGVMAAAACSPHASLALETAIHTLGQGAASCIANGLLGQGRCVAASNSGIHVVCRLLEHAARDPKVVALTDEVLGQDAASLCCHKFGHEIATSIVSNGTSTQRGVILRALRSDLQRFSRHRFAAQVVEQALLLCPADEGSDLAQELMSAAGAVAKLACHGFGMRVVQSLLEVPNAHEQALHYIYKSQHKLRKDGYGAELLRELGLDCGAAARELVTRSAVVGGA